LYCKRNVNFLASIDLGLRLCFYSLLGYLSASVQLTCV